MAWPSSLARTKNWGTEILTDSDLEGQFDLIINYINDMMSSTTGHKHDATTAEGPKILVSDLSLTSSAAGDILYHNGTNLVRLAKGTALQHLRMNSGATAPEWSDEVAAATQAEMESPSSTSVYVTPGRTQYHPGVVKGWARFNGSGTPAMTASHNIDSTITDDGDGKWTFTITTDFSSGSYLLIPGMQIESGASSIPIMGIRNGTSPAAGSFSVTCYIAHSGALNDPTIAGFALLGDQA